MERTEEVDPYQGQYSRSDGKPLVEHEIKQNCVRCFKQAMPVMIGQWGGVKLAAKDNSRVDNRMKLKQHEGGYTHVSGELQARQG